MRLVHALLIRAVISHLDKEKKEPSDTSHFPFFFSFSAHAGNGNDCAETKEKKE